MIEEFSTIEGNVCKSLTIKKSKFIANLFCIESVKEAEEKIQEIKGKYFDAKHNCIAYRVIENDNLVEKASDDGEPSGTAGQPMLNILQKSNLNNVLIVVTRYFGGILLGTGGLVRAYSDTLKLAIAGAEKIKKCKGEIYEVEITYQEIDNFKYYCKNNDINILNIDYLENIICKIELEEKKKEKIIKDLETKNVIKNKRCINKAFITKLC